MTVPAPSATENGGASVTVGSVPPSSPGKPASPGVGPASNRPPSLGPTSTATAAMGTFHAGVIRLLDVPLSVAE